MANQFFKSHTAWQDITVNSCTRLFWYVYVIYFLPSSCYFYIFRLLSWTMRIYYALFFTRDHSHLIPLFFTTMMPTAGRVDHIWHAAGHHRKTDRALGLRGEWENRGEQRSSEGRWCDKKIYMRYIKGCWVRQNQSEGREEKQKVQNAQWNKEQSKRTDEWHLQFEKTEI